MGNAWVDSATSNNNAHDSVECSNKGSCDRKTGECKCFDGYEGKACERQACPGNCNNRGRCIQQEQLAYEASATTPAVCASASRATSAPSARARPFSRKDAYFRLLSFARVLCA